MAHPILPPILYVFAISHYCEKARWALDHQRIPYRPHYVMPGLNRSIAKKLGSSGGSLPFLETDTGVVAGSDAILDWAESKATTAELSLAGDDPKQVRAIEQRLDDIIGIHVRRFYYSDALFSNPNAVRPIFSRDLSLLWRLALTLGWSKIVPRMIQGMNLGPSQGAESKVILAKELDWLDALLGDGRAFLSGGSLSRADITAASLLAPLVIPPKHPSYATLKLPDAVAAAVLEWSDRPSLRWVKQIYAEFR
jgi:glutathione S-transferase